MSIDPVSPKPKGMAEERRFWLALVPCLLLLLWFPADFPFLCDEPQLIENALQANADGRLADKGLLGTMGVHYGAPPTWIYQGLLAVTHDLVAISIIKHIVSLAILIACLVYLARRLSLRRWPIFFILLSPQVHLFHRSLWDNCFLIPLSMVFVVMVHRFLDSPTRTKVLGLTVLVVLLGHIHLMTGIIVLPAALLLLARKARWMRTNWIAILAFLLAGLAISFPYLSRVLSAVGQAEQAHVGRMTTFIDVLRGVNYFSFIPTPHFLPSLSGMQFILPEAITSALILTTGFVLPVFLFGIWASCGRALSQAQRDMAWLAIGTIAFTMLFHLLTGHFFWQHYLNGQWFGYFFFLWLGADWLAAHRLGRAACAAALISAAVMLGLSKLQTHETQGNRSLAFGTTMENQLEIAAELANYPVEVQLHVMRGPTGYCSESLKLLRRMHTTEPTRDARHLFLYYPDGEDGRAGRMQLSEKPPE
ncbi:MAG: hypothetical protein ACI8W8_001894 [Rhodothermales bacterium]|jgi:hypothetical protein